MAFNNVLSSPMRQTDAITDHTIRRRSLTYRNRWQRLHLDPLLLLALSVVLGIGLVVLYSATNQNPAMMWRQCTRIIIALMTLIIVAQIPQNRFRSWTPWLYLVGLVLLIAVLLIGVISKGAQRWLNLGFIRFQPSEIMKLAVPMMVAWYLSLSPLPPKFSKIITAAIMIFLPGLLIIKQPDLGTALMVMIAGGSVLLFAGISWRLVGSILGLAAISTPILWHYMHSYQRKRVLTFLNPESDPLGAGYHIIQSKIAIGSGGLLGKGWLHGTQSHLHFLPEHATDFIFAVCGEEFGLIGCTILIVAYLAVVARCLYIASQAQDSFTRLLASGLSLSFFLSVFVNIGMVTGILPVVGLPLPLISYGGTSMVTLMAGFGLIMSIHTHRKMWGS